MIQTRQQLGGGITAGLNREHALADGWDEVLWIEVLDAVVCHPESVQPSGGEDDRIDFAIVEFTEARIDIAAQVLDLDIGAGGTDQGHSS